TCSTSSTEEISVSKARIGMVRVEAQAADDIVDALQAAGARRHGGFQPEAAGAVEKHAIAGLASNPVRANRHELDKMLAQVFLRGRLPGSRLLDTGRPFGAAILRLQSLLRIAPVSVDQAL